LQVSRHVNTQGILDFFRIPEYALIRFIIFMLLKATDNDRAIGKYPIDRTPFLEDEKRQFL